MKMMIDIHTHILPRMDDGSGSTTESLELLRSTAVQGIGCIVATPHFYAQENDPQRFLSRRTACAARLREAWEPGLPRLLYGVEIDHYISLMMDGVAVLNDLAGGVTLKVMDDFGAFDPALVQGETVTLRGEQALKEYGVSRYLTIDGEAVEGEKHLEFYVDEAVLQVVCPGLSHPFYVSSKS